MTKLPFQTGRVGVPPIKCQGIKTKLVPFIFGNVRWNDGLSGRWLEPFLGSGVVAFNLAPDRALLSDTNPHIIGLYAAIQSGNLNSGMVRDFLVKEGRTLATEGAEHYYAVRERFNEEGSPLDFLFLNRSCFNGVMRFNRQGEFNVPFGHKPQRFSPSYITKISNQIGWVAKQMRGKKWEFRVARWEETLERTRSDDFVYLDPPYAGRHADYYNSWGEADAARLAEAVKELDCGFAVSTWLANRYRKNEHIGTHWTDMDVRSRKHFYHVGSNERYRNEMEEALIVKPEFAAPNVRNFATTQATVSLQLPLDLSDSSSANP